MNEMAPSTAPIEMVQQIVEFDEDGNPIVPAAEGEIEREVFVQTEDSIN
jgi:hypothetical protein